MNRHGIILLDKPAGVTSFKVLAPVKQALGHKKIGHTGTLDRFATGLLVLLAGSYTKLGSLFTEWDKSYEATFAFGIETATLDPEGDVVAEAPIPRKDTVERAMEGFRGSIRQRPPAYSAVHIAGKRAYERVLAGENVEIPEREVRIDRFELVDFTGNEAHVRVDCSKGTYIRSLARDLGRSAGSRAYVTALRRTRVGPFDVTGAVTPEEFEPERDLVTDIRLLEGSFRIAEIGEKVREGFLLGRSMTDEVLGGPVPIDGLWIMVHEGALAAAAEREDGKWKFRFVVPD